VLWAVFPHALAHVTVREAECLSTLENMATGLVFKCFVQLWK